MLYFKCPTCKTKLANRELYLENELELINNDVKTDAQTKSKLRSELIKKLELPRYCCRARIMTYVDLITIIK